MLTVEPDMNFLSRRAAEPVGLGCPVCKGDVFWWEVVLLGVGQVGFVETGAQPLDFSGGCVFG